MRLTTLLFIAFLVSGCAKGVEYSQGYGDGASSSGDCSASSRKRVFVSSVAYAGNLGGISGGDAKCAALASAAGLCGTWKAWLSNATTTAISRLADVGPWYHVDRTTLIFTSKAQIAAGTSPSTAPSKTETGGNPAVGIVWTGSGQNGSNGGQDFCQNWSSSNGGDLGTVGLAGDVNRWSDFNPNGCGTPRALYCFEQ